MRGLGSKTRLAQFIVAALATSSWTAHAQTSPAASGEPQQKLGKIKVEGTLDATTEGSGSYKTETLTLGKSDQSWREIPQSVSVITRQRMDDQNLISLEDALTQSTGFTVTSQGPGSGAIYARGFQVDTFQFDGVPQVDPNYSFSKPDLAIYDRVEVLRGSAGLLQGSGNPAATINLVRKRPTRQFALSSNVYVGSWDYYRAEFDIGGPVNESGSLRTRALVAYEDRDYSIDVAESQKLVLYGIAEYDLGSATTVTAGVLRQTFDAVPLINGLPRYSDGRSLPLSRSAYVGPDWNDWAFDTTQAFASLEHRWAEDWKAKLSLDRAWDEWDAKRTFTQGRAAGGAVDPATNAATISGALRHDENDRYGLDANVSGSYALFGRSHTLLAGAGFRRYYGIGFGGANLPNILVGNVLAIDPHSFPEPANPAFTTRAVSDTEQYGVYASTNLHLNDRLTLVVGGRFDWYDNEFRSGNLVTGVVTNSPDYSLDSNFTARAGVVWDLSSAWSLYASYADIFMPQTTQFTRNGGTLDPIVGANYEVGTKAELMDGRMNASFAVFRIDQTNRAQEDLTRPCAGAPVTGWCYVTEGEVISEGFEAEVSGALLPDWQLFAGYTYNTTEYEKDRINEGRAFMSRTPKHLLRLWSNYQLPGSLNRFSIGGGVNAQSSYYAESGTMRVEEDSYVTVNARVAWTLSPRFSVALNGNNLFDEKYFAAIGVGNQNVYGDPRNVMLTLRGSY